MLLLVLKQLIPLYYQDVWDRRRTGCTRMARSYSSVGEEAHLHLLAVKVYSWFVMIHSVSRGKTVTFNTKRSICAFDANEKQELPIITEKQAAALGVESWSALQRGSAPRWKSGIGSYCVHLHCLKAALDRVKGGRVTSCVTQYLWKHWKRDLAEAGQ